MLKCIEELTIKTIFVYIFVRGHHFISVTTPRLFGEDPPMFSRESNAPACKMVATFVKIKTVGNRLILNITDTCCFSSRCSCLQSHLCCNPPTIHPEDVLRRRINLNNYSLQCCMASSFCVSPHSTKHVVQLFVLMPSTLTPDASHLHDQCLISGVTVS